jgi:hypothetical protein
MPVDANPNFSHPSRDDLSIESRFDGEYLESKRSGADSLRVRCPHCRKLYLVQYADIHEAKPRFECVQCHNRFWLSIADIDVQSEIMGIPIQLKEAPPRLKASREVMEAFKGPTEPCPKCDKLNPKDSRECVHCGVLMERHREVVKEAEKPALFRVSPRLENFWQRVLADYTNETLHRDFINACQKENNLIYAASQYAQMQKVMPSDEMASRRIREVQGLAMSFVPEAEKRGEERGYLRGYFRLWQIPLLGAAVLIITGLALPPFRNMAGVGAAFLFLAIALQLQFYKRS